jgi:hypothetical protein
MLVRIRRLRGSDNTVEVEEPSHWLITDLKLFLVFLREWLPAPNFLAVVTDILHKEPKSDRGSLLS